MAPSRPHACRGPRRRRLTLADAARWPTRRALRLTLLVLAVDGGGRAASWFGGGGRGGGGGGGRLLASAQYLEGSGLEAENYG